jgi:hypothetical protein
MVENHIKGRDNELYRKFWITYGRSGNKKFKIISADRRRPNSGFKKFNALYMQFSWKKEIKTIKFRSSQFVKDYKDILCEDA